MKAKSRLAASVRERFRLALGSIVSLALGRFFPLALAAAIVLLPAAGAWACPGCKDALAANDGDGGNLVAGYFWSILFMMSMPFTILGTFSGSMYLAVRRARAQQPAALQHGTQQYGTQQARSQQALSSATGSR